MRQTERRWRDGGDREEDREGTVKGIVKGIKKRDRDRGQPHTRVTQTGIARTRMAKSQN